MNDSPTAVVIRDELQPILDQLADSRYNPD